MSLHRPVPPFQPLSSPPCSLWGPHTIFSSPQPKFSITTSHTLSLFYHGVSRSAQTSAHVCIAMLRLVVVRASVQDTTRVRSFQIPNDHGVRSTSSGIVVVVVGRICSDENGKQ